MKPWPGIGPVAWRPLLLALLLGVLAPPRAALAHALDEYLLASYITVAPDQILVELKLSPGVLVAPELLAILDPDGDTQIAAAAGEAYADEVLRQLTLELDGQPLSLERSALVMPPYLNLQTGYGELRISAIAALPEGLAGEHQLAYLNSFAPTGATYQANAFVERDGSVTLGPQQRDSSQQRLRVAYTLDPGALSAPTPAAATEAAVAEPDSSLGALAGASEGARQLLAGLDAPASAPWALPLMLAVAALLGGLHALTPGHGKTLVAAYLIGSRGTIRDAIMLGGTVTLTHTASVLLFGTLALVASQTVATSVLATVLELCAALLVVGLGARLAWVRWRALAAGGDTEAHPHPHPHPAPRAAQGRAGLLGLGLAGGALPCPEALAIMLVAVGLGRIRLGLGLIVSFSLGLAAVLIALGVLLVRAEARLKRVASLGGAWQRWLPLGSAAVVLLLGAGMLLDLLGRAELPPAALLATLGLIAIFASGYGLAVLAGRRRTAMARPSGAAPAPWLPPRYQGGRPVSAAPMGAAALRYDESGAVAWDTVWTDYCDLALAGGPPHRGTLLEAPDPEAVRRDPAGYRRVQDELARGLQMVTGLPIVTDGAAGWIGIRCADEAMATWMLRAILVENVAVRREGALLFLPAGPDFTLEGEIKNVVTVVAKTYHYWSEHRAAQPR